MRTEERSQPLTDGSILEYIVHGEFAWKETDVNSTYGAWWMSNSNPSPSPYLNPNPNPNPSPSPIPIPIPIPIPVPVPSQALLQELVRVSTLDRG